MDVEPDEDTQRNAWIERTVATAPPLTPQQISFLRRVLHGR